MTSDIPDNDPKLEFATMPEEGQRIPEPPIRRIVTGHDADGKAVVTMDGPATNHKWSSRDDVVSTLIWSTHECPAEMWTDEDFGARIVGTQPPKNGSRFCVIEFGPHTPGRMHRTDTVDYLMVISGKIDMDMDDSTVTMEAGDMMVQQGTNHAWTNRYDEPCRIAFVLVDGKPPPGGSLAIAEPMPPTPQPARPVPPEYAIRRIVTSHDADGKAVVMWDGPQSQWSKRERGNVTSLLWGSDETPAEYMTREDFGARENEIEPPPRGTWFRAIDYPAGGPGRMHRTDTVDLIVCLRGKIDMELDDSTVTMNAGDVMVQQGTNHSWINRYDEDCRLVFILMDAKKKPGS